MVKRSTPSVFLFLGLLLSVFAVRAQNAPLITSTPMGYPNVSVAENKLFNYAIAASDPNDDALTFTKVSGPSWLSLTTSTPSAVSLGSLPAATYQGVVADNAGNTYVAVQNGVHIYKITPDGTTSVFKTGRPAGTIYNLAFNDHYLYILNYGNNYISRIDLNDPTFAETTVLTGYSSPYGAAFRDGFMYVSSSSANKVIKVALSSLPATYNAGTMDYIVSGLSIPDGMDFDRNGNLYIANKGFSKVSMYNGTTLSDYITGIGPNNDVKFDRAGNFYIALQGASGSIVKYAAGTTTSPVTVPSGTGFIWAMNINPAGTLVFVQGNLTYKYETGAVLSGTPTHAEVGGPYSVTIRVDDGNGNTVDQSFTITVTDPNPPTANSYIPAVNSTEIASSSNLVLTFSETVQKGTGDISIRRVSDASLVETISVTEARVSVTGATLIINPAADLPSLSQLYVTIDAGVVKDVNNNDFVGISDNTTWRFATTGVPPGNALNFDGTNDYVPVNNNLGNSIGTGDFTVEAWVNTTTTTDATILAKRKTNGPGKYFRLLVQASGLAILETHNSTDAADFAAIMSSTRVNDGRYHHIAAGRSGNQLFMYIDGVAVTPVPIGATKPDYNDATLPFSIGARYAADLGPGYYDLFKGSIDEVRVYNTALTQANVQADMFSTTSSVPANLLAYYTFDSLSGTVLKDETANTHNGTLTNFALSGSASNWVESYAMVVPTVQAATNISSTGFTANWTAPAIGTVDNAYRLWVSTDANFSAPVTGYNGLSVSANSQAVTGLVSGTQYFYRVAADKTRVTGQGGYSANAAVRTTVALNSITRIDASPATAASVQYDVSFSGTVTGLSISNFQLSTTGGISGASITSVSGSGSTYTVVVNTGSGSGTIGLNLANATSISPALSNSLPFAGEVYTIDREAPGIPADFRLTAGNGQIQLDWTANTESDLASYKIYGGTTPGAGTLITTLTAGLNTYTHTGLSNGSPYFYRILAVDALGNESPAAAERSATPQSPQTITFAALADATYGDADITPGATASSGLDIAYSSDNEAVATIVDGKIRLAGVGTVTITASQAGNAAFLAAASQQQVLTVLKKQLSLSLNAVPAISKVYDGTTAATLAPENYSLTGIVGADVLTVSGTAVYDNKNAGAGKTVTANGFVLAGTQKDNYSLTTTSASTTGAVTAKPISLALNASPAITKIYDGSTAATLAPANYTLSGIVSGDVVSVSGTASYDDKNAGAGKTVTANGFVLAGAQKDNYSLSTTSASTTGAVTAKPLTLALNASPAITKVYDGSTAATLAPANYTLSGIESGDAVSVSGTASYDNKNAGTGKTVTANGFVLAGAQKDNYSLSTISASTTGAVTAKPLTLALNASPAITKIYDGSTAATLAPANYILIGVESGDVVSVSGTASYDNKNAGAGKTVTVNGFVLAGAQKDNYSLSTTSASTTGAVTAKPLTLALNASPAITKVYDGSTAATLAPANYTLSGIESGDAVSVSGTAFYDNKNAGAGKTVTANGFVLAGAQKDNYSLTTTSASTTGAVTAKPITLALNASPAITKVYDGSTAATLVPANYTLSGIESGDVVSVSGTASYDNKNAGAGKTITANGFVLAGAQKDNYSLSTSSAGTTGTIVKKVLTVTADNKTKIQGTANPVFTLSFSGFLSGEGVNELSTAPIATSSADLASAPGTYPITPAGGSAVNYSFDYAGGVLTVTAGAPTEITFAAATVFENQAANTLAGTFSSTSEDPNATFTYSLVGGDGSTDNTSFIIVGNQLRTAAPLDYEHRSSYSIRVRTTTQQGLSLEKQLTVNIQDVNEAPTLALVNDQILCYTPAQLSISLSGISAGPETSQRVTISASSSDPNLFDQFAISGNSLNYRIREGQSGTAVITVTVSDNGGTANGGVDTFSRSFSITVNALPQVSITTDKGIVELSKGETLVLNAAGGNSYTWDNSPGIISGNGTANLTVRPSETTTYRVTALNAAGCSVLQEITIKVNDDYLTVVGTNLLSPNGDGINDRLLIQNIDMYPNNEVKIFDRAGRLLYSQKNYTDQWDGTFNGRPLASGTYYYIVDFGPGQRKLKGYVSIVNE